ncbi:MAG: putative ATP-dependent RNA helicase DHR1 [Geoglossum simile]|nr:MAG: putative ATP-dependent RNA helicase DHR1 [Geoglossum simile]
MPKFVPRIRKHKKLQRRDRSQDDTNAAVVLPASEAEREEKRRRLREELRAQQPKISSKKQKRLDKYIDNKLKKEENLELIKKLTSTKIDTTLLRSSKSLGTVRESKREVLSRALRERQAGIDVERNNGILFQERRTREDQSGESSSDEDSDSSQRVSADHTKEIPEGGPVIAIGSGLKRPLDIDDAGNPVIKKIKKRGKRPVALTGATEATEPPWTGFTSESESDVGDTGTPPRDGPETSSEGDCSDEESDVETSSEAESEVDENTIESKKQRSSAFKAWATRLRNEALGFQPSGVPSAMIQTAQSTTKIDFQPRAPECDPLPPELETNTVTDATRKAFSVQVERCTDIQASRLTLPIVTEEQKIMEAIHNYPVVVVWGATGSGKTTQVPQFLYEAGYGSPGSPTPGLIGVTQPRRVAAVSMAKRVGDELGRDSKKVSYQIRFEGTVSDDTAIKFMTDGVLLREVAADIALRKYSAIIIDEAHERSINTDILIGLMSRVVKLRQELAAEDPNIKPLKLIIMSATLRVSDFTDNKILFSVPPPIIKAEGRQHSVTIHFARRTNHNYVDELYHKISRGHRKLPPGGMLVFLTGQNEITELSKRLKQAFTSKRPAEGSKAPSVRIPGREVPIEVEDVEFGNSEKAEADTLDSGSETESETEIVGLDSYRGDDDFELGEPMSPTSPMHVLPLYSLLPTSEQLKVFEAPPEGSRLVVLATNVAETSLTIPGIRYVFDCGRSKERKYDKATGVQSFEVSWISKASASQRAGRAGRVGPGHCYRLYSSAVYERDFEEYAQPEILRMPIEGIVLQLKSMNLKNVTNFPFPTPPDRQSLVKAEKLLSYLGGLDSGGQLTELGATMSLFPLSPRFAKILIIGHQHGCLPYIIAIVAALSVGDVFIPEHQLDLGLHLEKPKIGENELVFNNADRLEEDRREARRKAYFKAHNLFSGLDNTCDALKLLSAVCAYEHEADQVSFCDANFLHLKALRETQKLRQQITEIVRANCPGVIGPLERKLGPPSTLQVKVIKQIIAAGFVDQVAIRADLAPNPPPLLTARKPTRAIDTPYITLFPSAPRFGHGPGGRGDNGNDDRAVDPAVYIHPSSVLAAVTAPGKHLPPYVIYSHMQRSSTASQKIRMRPLTPITGAQLAAMGHGTPLISYGKPIKEIMPKDVVGEATGEAKREAWVVPTVRGAVGMGWRLPAKKVVLRKEKGGTAWAVVC